MRQMIFIGTILLFQTCITPFNPEIDNNEGESLLVVEGQITDQQGPFRVKLSGTFEVNNMQLYAEPVTGAEVQIFDDKGNHYPLYYTIGGWYETENKQLKGIVGNTYTLTITTADGNQYESTPVLMQDVPEIDSVYFEEVQRTRFEEGETIDETWMDIFVDSKDPTGKTKYWKWDFEETWEVKLLKDSVPFYYDIEKPLTKVNIKLADHVKETCWVTVPSTSILIASTNDNQMDEINKCLVKSIPPKNDRLHIKYSILIKQTALPYELYRYLKRLKESNEETGSMYEKIPEQIFGNIDCCNNSGKALGYFSASVVKTKRIFINPVDHHIETLSAYDGCIYLIPDIRVRRWLYGTVTACAEVPSQVGEKAWTYDLFCSDCREYGSEMKPDFWE